ncbi:hypothetical protein JXB11_01790 [Candidatus Woesearchaeota archaeon]|nr:hypothetical protein [Candidatus Woesearchaeota archaeon]
MEEREIKDLLMRDMLRKRSKDIPRISSLLQAAERNVRVARSIPLNEDSANIIFTAIYESLKQIGEAKWWALGYESNSHEATMRLLSESDIREKVKLKQLDRFRRIRNDANYRGYRVIAAQAKEILGLWESCGTELIALIRKEA